jgi:hypothetical protein
MSRPPFAATEAMREKVRYLSGLGVPHDHIAKIIECSPKTLRKHFRRELDRGAAEALAAVAGYLFQAAKKGNVTAQIFIMKTRGGWKETTAHEVSGPNGEPTPNAEVLIVLPDNGRDPQLTEAIKKAGGSLAMSKYKRNP